MFRTLRVPTLALLTLALGSACSSSNPAPPVPVEGERSDVSALAGRWAGEYSSEATGRTGSIVFEFKSGKVAHGDVLMLPKGTKTENTIATMPRVLNINFVNASGGEVKGTMDPYHDPVCECEVTTTFVGRITGDTIEGTFTTDAGGAAPVTTGRWKMTRQKK